VELEEKNREKVVEEEKKEEDVKVVEEQTREEYTEEKNQRWIMVVYKEALSPWIMHRCKEKTMMYGKPRGIPRKNVVVAESKKNGRPKRKSQWVQTPFTEGKKRKTKP
ncbi:unnamed protein product, partial [Brassica oleracea]